ncbi:uncharacterized protein B0H18DRAFT_971411 [Fomitopsis serialis]|uniref:uncharacterized protein n=1 Tax=Fomitopsis serialis TaxID=139415 RepID=UPI0020088B1D|nr:uncharacterized protein B0H18DRAFT_971411 [Neoantrodia serialis]KAH9937607.1 hypothetical protein B0H18DRAFT_971411 [Neoantrodia serialis]
MSHSYNSYSRTLLPDAIQSKSWEDRMREARNEKAVKTELSEETRAEKERFRLHSYT